MNRAPELEDEAVHAPEPLEPTSDIAPTRGLFVRMRDYAWDWRAVVAVGIATFIVGGLAGLAIGLAMGSGGSTSNTGFRNGTGGGFRQGGFPGGQIPGQGFGSGNGQMPNGG